MTQTRYPPETIKGEKKICNLPFPLRTGSSRAMEKHNRIGTNGKSLLNKQTIPKAPQNSEPL